MRRQHVRLFMIILAGFALAGANAQTFTPSLKGKKLIQYGWDSPNTAYVKANIQTMETHPFDGIGITVRSATDPNSNLGWRVFGPTRFQAAEYQTAISDLQNTTFTKFTDNVIVFSAMPGIDWFDPQWDSVSYNAGVMARIAKKGRCVGLIIDPEPYNSFTTFTYDTLPAANKAAHTREQYKAQAMAKGMEFMQAINTEFPNIKIYFFFGPSVGPSIPGVPNYYDLLSPFIEGMCRAADAGTEITDGFELAYGYTYASQFEAARNLVQSGGRGTFADTAAFDRVMRVGFGLWMDYRSASAYNGWHGDQPELNYYSLASWESTIRSGLSWSDRYVWIYTQFAMWWPQPNKPFNIGAYEAAQAAGWRNPGPGILSASPATQTLGWHAGQTTVNVANGSTVYNMSWTAQVVEGSDWLTIDSGRYGVDEGIVTLNFTQQDDDTSDRTGVIRITANGASGSPRDVTVVQKRHPMGGDANEDGNVNFSDYLALSSNFGLFGATWNDGEFTGDYTVNFADYLVLSSNFGYAGGENSTKTASSDEIAADDQGAPASSLPCLPVMVMLLSLAGIGFRLMGRP